MNSRVKLIRNQLNMSQGAFGKKLGVTGAGISKIENGKRNLTEQMLLMICKEFLINENWLRHGNGEIFQRRQPDTIEQLAKLYLLDDLDKRIITEYLKLDEKKRSVIKEYIMNIAYGTEVSDILKDGNPSTNILKCAEGPNHNY